MPRQRSGRLTFTPSDLHAGSAVNPTGVALVPAVRATAWSIVWLAGGTLMALRIFVGVFLTRRRLCGARTILDESAIRSIVPHYATSMVGVEESDNAVVPMTVGWPYAHIVLPTEWRTWPKDKVRAVMMHELAHVRRRDGLVTFLAAVNKAIFWFHPLAWWLERRLAELAEFAADDAAVRGASGIDPREYAAVLVEIASSGQAWRLRLISHPTSVDFARRGVVRMNRRIDRIFDSKVRTGSVKVVWATATVIAALSLVQFQRPVRAQGAPVSNAVEQPGTGTVAAVPNAVAQAGDGTAAAGPADSDRTRSQQASRTGGDGDKQEQQISEREKDIIAATFNQLNGRRESQMVAASRYGEISL